MVILDQTRRPENMKIIQITLFLVLLLKVSVFAEGLKIVAHRGASKAAPENTIPAFKLAWKQGADVIEGDFLLTKDGHIVCIHDRNTKRLAKKNKVVRTSTLAELRQLDVGVRHGEAFKDTVIPTIAEVFSTIPEGKSIFIEIKCGPEIIPALLESIKKSGLKKEQIVVICFNKRVIQKFKEKAPEYKASWLYSFKKDSSTEVILKTLKEIKADAFSSSKNINEASVREIIKHGYECHIWTINDLKTAKRFKEWGVTSITTDIPGELKKNLVEQGALAK
jgi:glycerophosphoryl diester phosphodiesterase